MFDIISRKKEKEIKCKLVDLKIQYLVSEIKEDNSCIPIAVSDSDCHVTGYILDVINGSNEDWYQSLTLIKEESGVTFDIYKYNRVNKATGDKIPGLKYKVEKIPHITMKREEV